MHDKPRVRFAPSPTGKLHIGNARTALYNWLFARHYGGNFILRIEDTDRERTSLDFEREIIDGLRWLSIDWDEGPDKGGNYGPYRQFERLELYDECLKKLIGKSKAYPCYCSDEELQRERETQMLRRVPPRYSGRCRNLSPNERKAFENEGRKPAWRFKIERGVVEFKDLIRGEIKFNADSIGDFIIVRSNGIPAYNFAAVIDDHHMEMSHVIRGEDHLSNTALQILLYRALGFIPPFFAHHSLILGEDKTKLSKRHGAVSVSEFRDIGILSEALSNYLSLLGSSFAKRKEVFPREDMIRQFSLEKTGRGGAVFDNKKLKWINGIYIRNYETDKLLKLLMPFISSAGYDCNSMDMKWLYSVVAAVKDNISTLSEIGDYIDIFFDDHFEVSEDAVPVLDRKESIKVINIVYSMLKSGTTDYKIIMETAKKETGFKGSALFMPVRAAVTGKTWGPELDKLFSILRTDSLIDRIDRVLKLTKNRAGGS